MPPGLEIAFTVYCAEISRMGRTGDWSRFPGLFTTDGVYRRHGYPDFVGRDRIRAFADDAMTTFPGNRIERFEVTWSFFVPSAGQAVFEVRHVMCDPGDGSHHAASTTSRLTYAGDGLWSRCDDLHSRPAYAEMVRGWLRAARTHEAGLARVRDLEASAADVG